MSHVCWFMVHVNLYIFYLKFSSLRSQIMVITTKANQVHLMLEELITLLPSPKQVQAPLHYDQTKPQQIKLRTNIQLGSDPVAKKNYGQ